MIDISAKMITSSHQEPLARLCFLCFARFDLQLTAEPRRTHCVVSSSLGNTNNEISISKCQGGTKSQPLPHCLPVAVRPEQSPMELHFRVLTEWATRVHRVQSETLRPPSTFETLKRMQLAEFGTSFKYAGRCSSSTKLLQIFISQNGKIHHPPTSARHDARCTWCRTAADFVRYPIHSPPFGEAEDLNVSGTGRPRARPRCTWQCNVVTSPFLTRVERVLNSSWFTVPAPAVCTTCQVSYRASDARSCHSDIRLYIHWN